MPETQGSHRGVRLHSPGRTSASRSSTVRGDCRIRLSHITDQKGIHTVYAPISVGDGIAVPAPGLVIIGLVNRPELLVSKD